MQDYVFIEEYGTQDIHDIIKSFLIKEDKDD